MKMITTVSSATGESQFLPFRDPIPSDHVIYIGTFSRSIAPAIRISYMVLPKNLLNIYERDFGFFSSTVSRIDQKLLGRFLAEGGFERLKPDEKYI